MKRVAVIGLDSAPPQLLFERWRRRLPTLRSLMQRGTWGRLRSCHPPITVPAWACMLSGKDPGQLGLYGFRNRNSYSYGDTRLAGSGSLTAPRVWDLLERVGVASILVGVPQTYPPRPLNGALLSCFLTPSTAPVASYPAALRNEIDALCGGYEFDVDGFRGVDRAGLLERIRSKTRKDFLVARHLLASRPWEFFMMVTMGPDRMQHAFWPREEDDEGWERLASYYELVDSEIAALLEIIGPEAAVLVVSDHGAKAMHGGVCLNEWLIANGYLTLLESPAKPTALRPEMIDWDRTRAWGEGGYCGRVFLNVRGREPRGTVTADDYDRMRGEIAAGLATIDDRGGAPSRSEVRRPEDLYAEVRGIAPDLMVYFDDLSRRALGSVGHGRLRTDSNDTGPDGANHDWDGVFILADADSHGAGLELAGLKLTDVAATILGYYADRGLQLPEELRGGGIRSFAATGDGARSGVVGMMN